MEESHIDNYLQRVVNFCKGPDLLKKMYFNDMSKS